MAPARLLMRALALAAAGFAAAPQYATYLLGTVGKAVSDLVYQVLCRPVLRASLWRNVAGGYEMVTHWDARIRMCIPHVHAPL